MLATKIVIQLLNRSLRCLYLLDICEFTLKPLVDISPQGLSSMDAPKVRDLSFAVLCCPLLFSAVLCCPLVLSSAVLCCPLLSSPLLCFALDSPAFPFQLNQLDYRFFNRIIYLYFRILAPSYSNLYVRSRSSVWKSPRLKDDCIL